MKLIELSKTGKHAGKYFVKVDEEDYGWLMKRAWQPFFRKAKNDSQVTLVYAIWIERKREGKDENGKKVRRFIKRHFMHREILEYHGVDINGKIVDHANTDTLDMQKHNLRTCTYSGNAKNTSSRKNATSKYLGVCKTTDKRSLKIKYGWMACIGVNDKTKHLGRFPFTKEGEISAALTYNTAAKKYHGEFANLNCVPIPTIPHKQYLHHS